jgi:signal transduction histidine kinase
MFWIILGILAAAAAYFAARYYGLRSALGKARKELEEIRKDPEANRTLKCIGPDVKLEALLADMNRCLRDMQRERIDFHRREEAFCREIENISHDLRTPLTAILGYVDLMDRKLLPEEDRDYLEVVFRKAKALEKLTEDFYALTRLEAGEYQWEPVRLDVNRMLNEKALDYYPAFEQADVEVLLFTREEPVWVLADESATERIFNNLLHNMTKYTKGLAEISLRKEEKQAVIEFVNDAADLQDEDASRIFERFYMADASRSGHSSGLGLPIARSLARQMGGDLSACVENGFSEEAGEMRNLKITLTLPLTD